MLCIDNVHTHLYSDGCIRDQLRISMLPKDIWSLEELRIKPLTLRSAEDLLYLQPVMGAVGRSGFSSPLSCTFCDKDTHLHTTRLFNYYQFVSYVSPPGAVSFFVCFFLTGTAADTTCVLSFYYILSSIFFLPFLLSFLPVCFDIVISHIHCEY